MTNRECGLCGQAVINADRDGYTRGWESYALCTRCAATMLRDQISGRNALSRVVTVAEMVTWERRTAL